MELKLGRFATQAATGVTHRDSSLEALLAVLLIET